MGRGVDTRDDGQGKANGPGLIPIDGDEGGVSSRTATMMAARGSHGGRTCQGSVQQETLGDQIGASLRGGRVVW